MIIVRVQGQHVVRDKFDVLVVQIDIHLHRIVVRIGQERDQRVAGEAGRIGDIDEAW